jgi:hypothetical protein
MPNWLLVSSTFASHSGCIAIIACGAPPGFLSLFFSEKKVTQKSRQKAITAAF